MHHASEDPVLRCGVLWPRHGTCSSRPPRRLIRQATANHGPWSSTAALRRLLCDGRVEDVGSGSGNGKAAWRSTQSKYTEYMEYDSHGKRNGVGQCQLIGCLRKEVVGQWEIGVGLVEECAPWGISEVPGVAMKKPGAVRLRAPCSEVRWVRVRLATERRQCYSSLWHQHQREWLKGKSKKSQGTNYGTHVRTRAAPQAEQKNRRTEVKIGRALALFS